MVIAITIVVHLSNKRRLTKKIERLRLQWGKPKAENFDFDAIRKYSDVAKADSFHQITEQTIHDIDFYKVFAFVDRTTSRVGQQFLFKKLIQPGNEPKNPLDTLIEIFASDNMLRESIQLEFSKLESRDANYISSLLTDNNIKRPKWFWLLYLNVAVLIGLFLLSFQFPFCIIVMLAPLTINMFIHYWNKGNTFQFVRSFPQLNILISVCAATEKKGSVFVNKQVIASMEELKSFQRKSVLLSLKNATGLEAELSLIGLYFIELAKIFFLVEVFALFGILRELKTKQSAIGTLFSYVGEIDSAISVLSLRSGTLKTCVPDFISAKKEISVKGIYHPLIENCVKNDWVIAGKSMLITGSNMSGKSTYLRTVTINSILAQTIFTCFADRFESPPLKQFSSIRIDDNLFEGKSFYFQEVRSVASLIEASEKDHQNLFVLDEVFKGTNTVERIASAKAILSYLNKNNNIVVVATHDIELAEMLAREYDLYHFTETVESNHLHFDHRLKIGPLKTRNAIKLLEISNYPMEIIKEARELSEEIKS
ncbi:MAG: DNA mismatch repair protein MutS [Chryseotalea sp. WA131a]|nr:MAG: DNA mismatch repair protein MutS [Chryseotalea sp. WA131a]